MISTGPISFFASRQAEDESDAESDVSDGIAGHPIDLNGSLPNRRVWNELLSKTCGSRNWSQKTQIIQLNLLEVLLILGQKTHSCAHVGKQKGDSKMGEKTELLGCELQAIRWWRW